jgi:hypothetical protein
MYYIGGGSGSGWAGAVLLGLLLAGVLSRCCVPALQEALANWREARRAGRRDSESLLEVVWYGAWYVIPPLIYIPVIGLLGGNWGSCAVVAAVVAAALVALYRYGGL